MQPLYYFMCRKKEKKRQMGRPAWQPAQAGSGAGEPPERAGLGAGPGRQQSRGGQERSGAPGWAGPAPGPGRWGGRPPTRGNRPWIRPRPALWPGVWPNGPAWEPAQAGSEAGAVISFSLLFNILFLKRPIPKTQYLLHTNSVFDNLGLVGIVTTSTTRIYIETSLFNKIW